MRGPGVLVGLLTAACLVVTTAPAAARHGGRRGGVPLSELLAAAQAQQQAGDLGAARATLEHAYQLQPSPDVLCALGSLALADGRRLDAEDALRRCAAASPKAQAHEPPAAPRPESGELSVTGPHRGLVFVDGHVVGALPLTRPLLLAPGPHRVQLTGGALSTEVQVLPGRAALLSLAGKPTLTPLPAVALLVDFTHSPSEAGPLLRQAAAQAVQSQHLGLLGQWGDVEEKLELSGCADAVCEHTLAQKHRLRYVMAARAAAEPDGWQLWAQLFDAEIGCVASEQAADCEHCTIGQAGARLSELLTQALRLGKSRPIGILEVTSTPPGGDVLLSGLRLGQTPLRRAAFAGEHAIVVQHAGFAPYQKDVVVEPGRGAALDATLRESVAESAPPAPLPAPAPPPPAAPALASALPERPVAPPTRPLPPAPRPATRPRWRVGLGAATTALGSALLGFGIAGLTLDGRCTEAPIAAATGELCPSGRVINSGGAGATLLAAGLTAVGIGATLLSLPGARPVELRAVLTASPTSGLAAAAGGTF